MSHGVARFKTPELVVQVDEIPLLGIGKPDRALLRDRAAEVAKRQLPRGREPGGTVAMEAAAVGGGGQH
jgi:acyl-CoA synthetase (AMP-forming)/AMP-acid ligase II